MTHVPEPFRPPDNPYPPLIVGFVLLVPAIVLFPVVYLGQSRIIAIPIILLLLALGGIILGAALLRKWLPYRRATTPEERRRHRDEYFAARDAQRGRTPKDYGQRIE